MSTHLRQQLHVVQSLRDGSIRKIPLNGPQSIPAEAGSRYAIVDAVTGKTPDNLQVRRHGDSLIIESEDPTLRVEIGGFYQESGTVFVPSGQLNGETLTGIELTSSSPVLSTTPTGDSIVWSADSDTNLWSAVGLVGLGAVGAGVAVGNGGAAATPDTTAPVIASGATAPTLNENSGASQVVYTAIAADASTVTYSLKPVGDAAAFSINASTGAVTLTGNPDFETKASYSFTVVATDAAGNASEQAVSLGINNLDEVAPSFTSGAAATAINENSGAGQTVYTATSTDAVDFVSGTTTYSLKPVGDAAAFSINASTGAVTLTGNPDFETKASYSFTVIATDAAGNASERAVTLAINDLVDEVAPSVSSVAISSATGVQNSTLNAGDVVSVTVTMDEATVVSTAGGTPQIALNIGGTTVQASYASGSGTTALVFNYTVQAGQTDTNGIAIGANALALNGGTLQDAAGNAAVLTHGAVADNAGFLVDTTAPVVTSGATATAINENSGAGQVVYTAAATDAAAVTYSLKAVGDAAAFTINAGTGAVTLTGNPDFETKASYSFTVVATDAAGNASERAVSLGVNDLDDTAPAVSSVAITGATGSQNSTLNAGDVVSVTVTMDEATVVSTAGGTPQIALNIGGTTVQASYASGSGTTALVFNYTVQAGQTDANGIAIGANALALNGGTLRDAANNNAILTHGAVADNAGFLVDTAAPTLNSSTPADNATVVAVGDNIVLTFSENVVAGSGNIVISNGAGDTRTIAVGSGQVSIVGNQVTVNPTADLNAGSTYNVQMASGVFTDAAGNAYAGISNATTLNFDTASSVDTSIVVFDLLGGASSSHSGRSFQAGTAYTIYIRVDSNSATLDTTPDAGGTWGAWSGANNLGADDRIVLVGSGSPIQGADGTVLQSRQNIAGVQTIAWENSPLFGSPAAVIRAGDGLFLRIITSSNLSSVVLWGGGLWAANPNLGENNNFANVIPAGILTSQGLT